MFAQDTPHLLQFFSFNHTPTSEIYTLSLHDALPIWLGASVFILGHRHPVVMAKMLTSIDALSHGRLICGVGVGWWKEDRKSTRLNSSHVEISYAVFCLKKKKDTLVTGMERGGRSYFQ